MLGHADGPIELIELRTRASTPVPAALTEGLIGLAWAPDGSTFAGAAQDRTVLVWDADTLEVDAVLRGHWGRLSQLAYSPDGRTVYAAGLDQTVLAWDLTGDRGVVTAVDGTRPTVEVDTEALAADGSLLAIGFEEDQGGRVEVIELPGAESFRVTVPQWPLNRWALTAERQGRSVALVLFEYAAIGNRRMWVHTVDVQRRELRPRPRIELKYRTGGAAVFTWGNEAVLAAGYSPHGLPQAGLWGLAEDAPPDPDLYEPGAKVWSVGVDPERRVAAFSEPRQIEVIDLSSGELVKPLIHGEILLATVVFSPDGRWLAAATGSGRVSVWDTGTWEQHTSWEAVPGFVVDSMVFTPDSDFLVTGGAGRAAIWTCRRAPRAGSSSRWTPAGATRTCWSASVTTAPWSPSARAPAYASGTSPRRGCSCTPARSWGAISPSRNGLTFFPTGPTNGPVRTIHPARRVTPCRVNSLGRVGMEQPGLTSRHHPRLRPHHRSRLRRSSCSATTT